MKNLNLDSTFLLGPEIILLISVVFLLIFVSYIKWDSSGNVLVYNKVIYEVYYKTVLWLIFVIFYIVCISYMRWNWALESTVYMLHNTMLCNEFTQIIKLVVLFFAFIYLILLNVYMKKYYINLVNFTLIMLLSVEAIFFLISSNDLFLSFISLELFSLCVYVMLGSKYNSSILAELGWKFFIISCLGFLIGLYGVSLIYCIVGTTRLDMLHTLLVINAKDYYSIFGISLIYISLFFKFGLFPFHYWINYLYNKGYLFVIMFISIIPKFGYLYFFFQLCLLYNHDSFVNNCILIIGVLSIIYGTIRSLYESSLIKLLGWSSITNMGYVIIGISLNTIDGIVSSFFYLLVYNFLLFFFFAFILNFYIENKKEGTKTHIDNITSLRILSKDNYIYCLFFSTILLSMGGLPFFGGFYSKWYLLLALINGKNYVLTVLVFLFSVIGLIYYIRLVRFLFFDENKGVENIDYIIIKNKDIIINFIIVSIVILNIIMIIINPYLYLYIKHFVLIIYT